MHADPSVARNRILGPRSTFALKLAGILGFMGLCVWLAFPTREAFVKAASGMRELRGVFVLLFFPTALLMHVLRAWRWDFLLRPLGAHIPFGRMLVISSIGFMAILALPVRLGEFVRPYLVAEKGRLRMSAALGSVAVERTVDGLLVSLYIFVSFLFVEGPYAREASLAAWASLGLFGLATAFIAAGVKWPDGMLRWLMRLSLMHRIAPSLASRVEHVARGVIEGFRSMKDLRNFGAFVLVSAAYWAANGLGMWVLARGFNLGLSLDGAFATMALIAAAITLPNTPGLVGQFHAAGKFALLLYLPASVVESGGMACVVTAHALQTLWYVGAGLLSMLVASVPLLGVVRASRSAVEGEERNPDAGNIRSCTSAR